MNRKHDVDRRYELRVLPRGDSDYGLALFQNQAPGSIQSESTPMKVVQVWGDPLKATLDHVLVALRLNGYKATHLTRGRKKPFELSEADGVKLGLLFMAVKPLRRLDRIEAISAHIGSMEPEELYYWFSKTTATKSHRRAKRALRILIAQE